MSFYGLSAVMLTLSPIPISAFKESVRALDTSVNRQNLHLLKYDLEKLMEFIDNLPTMYESIDARRAQAKLKSGRYSSEEEKAELEEFLVNQPKTLSRVLNSEDNRSTKVSDLSYEILSTLLDRRSRIQFFYDNTSYSKANSGVQVLGDKLYLLRNYRRSLLNNRIYKMYKGISSKDVDMLEKDVVLLESYLNDGERVASSNKVEKALAELGSIIDKIDVNFLNNLFDADASLEEYYDSCLELDSLGLFGFTPFIRECFNTFKTSVSVSASSDTDIYKGTDLYNFVLDLREVLDSYKSLRREGS